MRRVLVLVGCALFASSGFAAEPPKIGAVIEKLRFTDIRSLPRTLDDFGEKKAFVLVFTNTTCPVAQRYLPTLNELEKTYRERGVQFLAVNADADDSLVAMATQSVRFDAVYPFVKDFDGRCTTALGVTRTPQAVVLDAKRTLVYRGRIDDQNRLGGVRKEATRHELRDAIDAVLAGKRVAVTETEVDGCPITVAKAAKPRDVNYAEHVAPILLKHCGGCHQEKGSAPFALTTYKHAAARSAGIAEVVADQRMPPWFASHEFGPFVNRPTLTDDERTILRDWAKTGAESGDLSKAPAAPKPAQNQWRIGTPDRVLKSGRIELAAKGDIPYQYTVLPHVFTEDTWVTGVQILPDNARVLHHCNMAFGNLTDGFTEKNFVTGQVPGGEPMDLDGGLAFRIPKGSVLALQMHFVSTGKPERCEVSVGLRFAKEPVTRQLRSVQLAGHRFAIPAGDPAYKVAASFELPADVIGVGLFSHMHLRGKDMTFTARTPENTTNTLLIVPNYNFSWQLPYRWEPGKMRLAKGTRLECVGRFDNSAFNPYNPDPTKIVRPGPQTYQEMMIGFFFYTHADEKLNLDIDPKTGTVRKP